MHRVARFFLLSLWMLPLASLQADLVPHTAEYKVKISVASGELRTELLPTGTGFVARHVLEPKGLAKLFVGGSVNEMAEFAIEDDDVVPLRYESDDTLDDDEVHARVQFDWDAGEAVGTVNDEALVTPLAQLTHDRISIQYALMHDLGNDRMGSRYHMFEPDRLRVVNARTIGKREVRVPAGRFEAIGIQHQAENSSRVMTMWCVEELGYLPVIIEQHRKGKLRVRATLREYSPISTETD